jgi:hypothetical protein
MQHNGMSKIKNKTKCWCLVDLYPKRDREDVTNEGMNNHGRWIKEEEELCNTMANEQAWLTEYTQKVEISKDYALCM